MSSIPEFTQLLRDYIPPHLIREQYDRAQDSLRQALGSSMFSRRTEDLERGENTYYERTPDGDISVQFRVDRDVALVQWTRADRTRIECEFRGGRRVTGWSPGMREVFDTVHLFAQYENARRADEGGLSPLASEIQRRVRMLRQDLGLTDRGEIMIAQQGTEWAHSGRPTEPRRFDVEYLGSARRYEHPRGQSPLQANYVDLENRVMGVYIDEQPTPVPYGGIRAENQWQISTTDNRSGTPVEKLERKLKSVQDEMEAKKFEDPTRWGELAKREQKLVAELMTARRAEREQPLKEAV